MTAMALTTMVDADDDNADGDDADNDDDDDVVSFCVCRLIDAVIRRIANPQRVATPRRLIFAPR